MIGLWFVGGMHRAGRRGRGAASVLFFAAGVLANLVIAGVWRLRGLGPVSVRRRLFLRGDGAVRGVRAACMAANRCSSGRSDLDVQARYLVLILVGCHGGAGHRRAAATGPGWPGWRSRSRSASSGRRRAGWPTLRDVLRERARRLQGAPAAAPVRRHRRRRAPAQEIRQLIRAPDAPLQLGGGDVNVGPPTGTIPK